MLVDNLKGIIFDLDNTLVKISDDYLYDVVKNTLNEIGYRGEINREQSILFWRSIDKNNYIIKTWNVDNDTFWKSFRKYDNVDGRISNTKIFDDVYLLRKLNNKIGIFTESIKDIALAEIDFPTPTLPSTWPSCSATA